MRSFGILSFVATVAFSAFASAAPLASAGNPNVVARNELPSVPQILDGLVTDLTPIVDKITAITGTGDIVDKLNPILEEVVGIVGGAVSSVDALVGSPDATILLSVDATVSISVGDVAQLLAKVLTIISAILQAALAAVDGKLSALGAVVGTLNQIVLHLVVTLLGLVGGLLPALLPLIGGLLSTLTTLGLTSLGSILGGLTGLVGL